MILELWEGERERIRKFSRVFLMTTCIIALFVNKDSDS